MQKKKKKKANKRVSFLYVCVAENGEMLVYFSFFPQQWFAWTIIFQNIGFEPYGVISWPQGAPIANHR